MNLLNARERLRILTGTQLLRRRPDWQAGFWSGLVAGTVMAAAVLIAEAVGPGIWRPVHLAAAVILGPATAALSTPDLAVLVVAALVHYALSAAYALVIADATVFMKTRAAVLTGAIFGAALYALNFYAFAILLFPWFAHARGWGALLAHVAFGACAALVYKRMENPIVRKPKPRGPSLRASWRAP